MTTAIAKLQPSKLDSQRELLKDDISLDKLLLFIRGKRHAEVQQLITDGEVTRTVIGASTVIVTVLDDDFALLKSGLLSRLTDINIDGLYFRLVKVEGQDDRSLSLTFEDREVALLRQYHGFTKANRDTMTRAEFVHTMVREVKEENIRFFSPQEKIVQPIAPDPNDQTAVDYTRGGGFPPGVDIRVKGVPATTTQIANTNLVLQTGANMGVPTIAQQAAVETINVESSALNLRGGDRDSVGIFQQRNSPPWNKRNRRDVAAASRTFFEQALAYLDKASHRGEHVYSWTLAQAVQISAFPDRYRQVSREAGDTVDLWQGAGNNNQGSSSSGNSLLDSSGGSNVYEFSRGTIDEQGRMTRENSWDCMQRLADEVDWRCFMVSGTVYFIRDAYLFKSRPRIKIDSDLKGIDSYTFDYDHHKQNSRVTLTAHVSRWGAPPGSVVVFEDFGPITGRWLVETIRRSLFDTVATIDLVKPLPKLPEPPPSAAPGGTSDQTILGPTSDMRQAIVRAAQRALATKSRYHYRQYRPMADSLFDAFAYDHTDCSAFATLCYKAGGAPDPNGYNYNGSGYTGSLWTHGHLVSRANAQPADLVFYGINLRKGGAVTSHVGVYEGNGMMIDFGSDPIKRVSIDIRSDFLGIRSYLDQRSG